MSDEFKVQWSVSLPPAAQYAKGDMLNIRGNSPEEVEEQFDAILRGEFIDKATQVANELRSTAAVVDGLDAKPVNDNGSNQQQNNAGSGHYCTHGQRVRREGNGRTGHWVGYFCPLEKGNPDQCKPEFEDSK